MCYIVHTEMTSLQMPFPEACLVTVPQGVSVTALSLKLEGTEVPKSLTIMSTAISVWTGQA